MSTYPPFERRYLLDEILRLRTLFGTQAFWALSEERRKQVTGGLLYVYLHTAEINESDTALFEAIFTDCPHPYRFEGTADECRNHCLEQMDKALAKHKDEVAAVVVEPLVQGAAGLIVHPEGFLAGVARLAREYGVLLIVDEVATGFGKTGTMFACEQEEVQPDIMCLAKGLTGGYLPVAATLASQKVFEA